MNWVAFAYSLSTKEKSSARVAVWRRLQRLGAIAPAGNLYLLPATAECVEAFQWLTQEVQQAGGRAVMLYHDQIEGMSEQALIELFNEARAADYADLLSKIEALEATVDGEGAEEQANFQSDIAKLRRYYFDIHRIDYFDCPTGAAVAARLAQLEQQIAPEAPAVEVVSAAVADYQGQIWVTRPQPHVDRLASSWLIRRFIDANATIRYGRTAAANEISFDMADADFGHIGNLCTFETMVQTFQISAAGLQTVAEIVHEIDLNDGRYLHPEAVGIAAVLEGWLQQSLTDEELEARGLALFDGLLAAAAARGG